MRKTNGDFREAISLLPTLSDVVVVNGACNDITKYRVTSGTSSGLCLYESETANISRYESKAGTQFEEHIHNDIYEYFIMEYGEMEITLLESGAKILLKEKDVYVIKPNILHKAKMLTDTAIIAVTMPPDTSYPHKTS